jgi:hypothetical protein
MSRLSLALSRTIFLLAGLAWVGAALGGTAPAVKSTSEKKKEAPAKPSSQAGADADEMTVDDNGLELGNAMVIEGRVEKPQVQFPLLREAPPVRDIHFDQSFMENILKLDRENVPDPQYTEKK